MAQMPSKHIPELESEHIVFVRKRAHEIAEYSYFDSSDIR